MKARSVQSVVNSSFLLDRAPQRIRESLHSFVAGVARHSSMFDLAFGASEIGGIRAELADVEKCGSGVDAGSFHERIFLGILPELTADDDGWLAMLLEFLEQIREGG